MISVLYVAFQRFPRIHSLEFIIRNHNRSPNLACVALTLILWYSLFKKICNEQISIDQQTKGLIKEALELCASRGLYYISSSIQNMLLDRGYAEIVCSVNEGAFISHMKPEEAVKFLLMQVRIASFQLLYFFTDLI